MSMVVRGARTALQLYQNPLVRRYAATAIKAAWRGYKARRSRRTYRVSGASMAKRRRIGVNRSLMFKGRSNPARRIQQLGRVLPDDDPAVERTLYIKEMCAIQQGTGITERNRDAVRYVGTKICMNVLNATDVGAVYFNYAVIRPKDNTYPNANSWFRSNGTERVLSFSEPTLSAYDYHCRPLSGDDKYIILHKKWKLAPEATGNWGNIRPTCSIDKYVPINKTIFFEERDGGEKCTTPYFFCYWFALEGGNQNTDHTNIDAANIDLRLITYFRNPPS